jgi:predicted RNA-binding protein YlqC (UPF0109 family)
MSSEGLEELIAFIARSLVDQPDAVQVEEVDGPDGAILELRVAADDLGKVIGKQGRTARALRTVLQAASTKLRKRVSLEILE